MSYVLDYSAGSAMTARLEFNIRQLKGPLICKPSVELLIDGEGVGTGNFGDTIVVEVTPGIHQVQAFQHSLIKRTSNVLEVEVSPNSTITITGKYSRLWGHVRIFV